MAACSLKGEAILSRLLLSALYASCTLGVCPSVLLTPLTPSSLPLARLGLPLPLRLVLAALPELLPPFAFRFPLEEPAIGGSRN